MGAVILLLLDGSPVNNTSSGGLEVINSLLDITIELG